MSILSINHVPSIPADNSHNSMGLFPLSLHFLSFVHSRHLSFLSAFKIKNEILNSGKNCTRSMRTRLPMSYLCSHFTKNFHSVPLICYVKTGFRVQHELLNWCIVKYLTRQKETTTFRMLACFSIEMRENNKQNKVKKKEIKNRTMMISISLCAKNVYLRFMNHLCLKLAWSIPLPTLSVFHLYGFSICALFWSLMLVCALFWCFVCCFIFGFAWILFVNVCKSYRYSVISSW